MTGHEPETDSREDGREIDPQAMAGEAYPLLKEAVGSILKGSDEARAAYEALLERGFNEDAAREEIARVLLATMFHIGAQSGMLEKAGGGARPAQGGVRPTRGGRDGPGDLRGTGQRRLTAAACGGRCRSLPAIDQFRIVREVEPVQELLETRVGQHVFGNADDRIDCHRRTPRVVRLAGQPTVCSVDVT